MQFAIEQLGFTYNLSHLELPFTNEQIDEVIMHMTSDKSPDLMDLMGSLRKKCWHLIKARFYKLCNDFYEEKVDIQPINTAFITLIPKINSPQTPANYRPISLISMPMKLITKLLANRVQREIISPLSRNQYGFIKNINIYDYFSWA